MPLFEFKCSDCGAKNELLVSTSSSTLECQSCGSANLKKMLSVPSSLSGVAKPGAPFQGAPCCGSSPGEMGCPGPGSCCAKAMD